MKDITKYQGVFPAFYACYDAEGNISVEGVKAPNVSHDWQCDAIRLRTTKIPRRGNRRLLPP